MNQIRIRPGWCWLVLPALLMGIGAACKPPRDGVSAVAATTEIPTPAPPEVPPFPRFGLNGGLMPPPRGEEPQVTENLAGLGTVGTIGLRHLGTADVYWMARNPEPGVWDWAATDEAFEATPHPRIGELFAQANLPYAFSGEISQRQMRETAQREGVDAMRRRARANAVNLDDPAQREHCEEYVRTVVARYKDRIHYWEIGNEALGEPTILAVHQAAYGWIKEEDPTAQVLMSGMAGTRAGVFDRRLEILDGLLAQGMGAYFDIANYHDYDDPAGMAERYDRFAAVLAKHGLDKPIWVTETGSSSEATRHHPDASPAQQSRDVVRRLVIPAARGAQVVLWHNFRYTQRSTSFFGNNLVSRRTGTKPAWSTFVLLVDQLGGYETAAPIPMEGIQLYKFTFAGGKKPVYVAWSDSPATVDLTGELGPTTTVQRIVEQGSATPAPEDLPAARLTIDTSPVFLTAP